MNIGRAIQEQDDSKSFGEKIAAGMWEGILDFFAVLGWQPAITEMERGVGAQSPATKMHPMGIAIGQGIAEGMMLDDSLKELDKSALGMVEHLTEQAGKEKGALGKALLLLGRAFDKMIAKGIKMYVNDIIAGLDAAIRRAREYIQQLGAEAAAAGGLPSNTTPGTGQYSRGGYVNQGGTVHKGEFVIPAMLTRAMMRPTQQSTTYNFNNNVSGDIDSAHLLAMVRTVVRKEIASAI